MFLSRDAKNFKDLPVWLPHLLGVTLITLLIVVLTFYAIWQDYEKYKEWAILHSHDIADLMSQHVSDLLDKTDALLRSVAIHYSDELVRGAFDAERFSGYLAKQQSLMNEVNDLHLLDADGVLRAGTGGSEPINVVDRDFFMRARDHLDAEKKGPIFFGPVFVSLRKQWMVVLARRLENPDGTFNGIPDYP